RPEAADHAQDHRRAERRLAGDGAGDERLRRRAGRGDARHEFVRTERGPELRPGRDEPHRPEEERRDGERPVADGTQSGSTSGASYVRETRPVWTTRTAASLVRTPPRRTRNVVVTPDAKPVTGREITSTGPAAGSTRTSSIFSPP